MNDDTLRVVRNWDHPAAWGEKSLVFPSVCPVCCAARAGADESNMAVYACKAKYQSISTHQNHTDVYHLHCDEM